MEAAVSNQAGEKRWRQWVTALGPGAAFILASIGPQDLVSNAAMGASYGYKALWALVLILVVKFAVLESASRYVVVTGESLLEGYRRVGRWAVWLIFAAILLRRHISNISQLLLLGAFAHMLAPLPWEASARIWSVALWMAGFALMFWGRYEAVQRVSKPLVTALGACLLLVAVLSRPRIGEVASGFWPGFPEDTGPYAFMFLLMSLAGSASGSLGNFKYAAFVREAGWGKLEMLRKQRMDLILSVASLFLMGLMIQIAAASALRPRQVHVVEVEDLVPLFSEVLGELGRLLITAGILVAVLNTYIGTNTGYSMVVTDIYLTEFRRQAAPAQVSRTAVFRWWLAWFCLSPLYALLTGWRPVWVTLLASALVVLVLPLVITVLLKLNNHRDLLGSYANGWLANTVLVAALLASTWLAWENGKEVASSVVRRLSG